jgi:hypothetical protein
MIRQSQFYLRNLVRLYSFAMSKPNDTLTLPPISPSFSEITDWNQVLTINDVQTTSSRIKALEDAVKQLQQ